MNSSDLAEKRGAPTENRVTLPWCADRGDGTYQNPVLFADYSDPDAIRVGDDYWLTASSFSHVPGLPILHSRDLVNWTIVNHALPALVPVDHFSRPRHGEGVWAPSIRYHDGTFWIYYPDPDFGIYVVTARDPRGAWSPPVMVKAGKGLIDPCPFWDRDGTVYLIHGWAKSRAGIKNRLTLHRMNSSGTAVADAGVVVIDGDQIAGWDTLEGPKLYQRDGWFYVFAPAGGVRDGYQAVFRARNIAGPYEHRIVLAQGSTAINGPHQGAWIDTPAGENWFLHFQEVAAYGRVVHLQPMQWRDGWPIMGRETAPGGAGEPVVSHRKPAIPGGRIVVPATSDEFESSALGLQWQWQANPQPGWASLIARPGSLRLACIPSQTTAESLWSAANLLLQKFPGPAFAATTRMNFSPRHEGDTAGLIVFGHDYAWLGLRRNATGIELVLRECRAAHEGGIEDTVATIAAPAAQVTLRAWVAPGARVRFFYRFGEGEFQAIGAEFQAVSSYWVGAKVGLFATAPANSSARGHADFDWFRVDAH